MYPLTGKGPLCFGFCPLGEILHDYFALQFRATFSRMELSLVLRYGIAYVLGRLIRNHRLIMRSSLRKYFLGTAFVTLSGDVSSAYDNVSPIK